MHNFSNSKENVPATTEIFDWLKAIKCEQYSEKFVSEGCESLNGLRFLTDEDLIDFGVKRIHRRIILDQIANPPNLDVVKAKENPSDLDVEKAKENSNLLQLMQSCLQLNAIGT